MFDHKQHKLNQQLDRLAEGKFDAMTNVLPEGQQGVAKIDHFTIGQNDLLVSIADHHEDFVHMGRYARLKVNGEVMMTDSPMEKRTNLEVIERSRGRVLIAGLGLGMILRPILRKPEVTHVTVLERYQDVVDLVLPSLAGDRKLEVIVADVFAWKPNPDTPKYSTIYFDIWPNSTIRHLPEMEYLYKRYRPLLARGGWMDSWTYGRLKEKKKADAKFIRELPGVLERHWREQTPEEFSRKLHQLLHDEAANTILAEAEKDVIRRFAASKGIPVIS